MRSLCLLSVLLAAAVCHAGPEDESKAKAALAIAKAKREREAEKAAAAAPVEDWYDYAAARARRLGKPLVVWVGLSSAQYPEVKKALDAVHVELAEYGKDKTPRVVIRGGDGTEWFYPRPKLGPETAAKIKAKWAAAKASPPLRTNAAVGEVGGEARRAAVPCCEMCKQLGVCRCNGCGCDLHHGARSAPGPPLVDLALQLGRVRVQAQAGAC